MTSPPTRSRARDRVALTARALFAQHGVDATTMQLVADELGVSKSAVFYHFRTKRELVEACVAMELAGLEAAIEEAEALGSRDDAREVLLDYAISRAVERRREPVNLQNDPAMVRFLEEQGTFRALIERYQRAFYDLDDPVERVDAAIMEAVISQAVTNPLLADLDDDQLRAELTRVAHLLLR